MTAQWDTNTANGEIRVEVRGNLDAQHAGKLRDQLRTLAGEANGQRIVLDMAQVPFMDSTGLASLVSGLKAIRQHEGEMALANVTPAVMRIFQITLLDRAFTFI